MRGLEPPPGLPDTDLNRARLPIPPHPRGVEAKISQMCLAPCGSEGPDAGLCVRVTDESDHAFAPGALLASGEPRSRRYRPGD